MEFLELSGGEAFARAALASGIQVVTSYPGSPSSEVVQYILDQTPGTSEPQVHWASNERVALEIAIGVSIGGKRALVCTKSVGLNVMLDPLMTLNLTPVHGGLVILLGDDPGGYGSQNDQDSRTLARALEMPLLEPATPADAYDLMLQAFVLSERFQTPIVLRETRSFAQSRGQVTTKTKTSAPADLGFNDNQGRFVPVPSNAVDKHRQLHQRLADFSEWAETSEFVEVRGNTESKQGIVAAGFAYQKLLDVLQPESLNQLKIAKVKVLYPTQENGLGNFLRECTEVFVVEESEPLLEAELERIAYSHSPNTRIIGKLDGYLRPEGELFRWQLQQALREWLPTLPVNTSFLEEGEANERPQKASYCTGNRYHEILDAIDQVGREYGQRPLYIADPGCLVTLADRLTAKYAIGSSLGVADGLVRSGTPDRVIAIFGDSAFFHSALPALADLAVSESRVLAVVLDNKSTKTSGNQPHPGVGRDARYRPCPRLEIATIAAAIGVPLVQKINIDVGVDALLQTIRSAWIQPSLTMIVVEIPTDHDHREMPK